jgi:hypothetical protein
MCAGSGAGDRSSTKTSQYQVEFLPYDGLRRKPDKLE